MFTYNQYGRRHICLHFDNCRRRGPYGDLRTERRSLNGVRLAELDVSRRDMTGLKITTQKGVDNNKIFELRAETSTERSLGCQMTIAKKNRLLGQTGGVAGLETCKKCHFFLGIEKKEFLATRGHPWGVLPKENLFYSL